MNKKKYVAFHIHDDTSNCNGYADSCTKFDEYIKLAKKNNMDAIAFSNHGGIYDWIKKKQYCDKNGIKYIHGIELYLCVNLEDNHRGWHIGLYAKNLDGVSELNSLISKSTSKGVNKDNTDRHFYHNPRISFNELMNTSSNIIVTTACLLSALWKLSDTEILNKENRKEIYEYNLQKRDQLLKWLSENNDRCFLEIQYHKLEHQKLYNQMLYKWSLEYNIPLIAGTDTHSSTKYKAECRKILQISKDSFYGEEDECDLVWKSYDELVECFKNQDALPEDIYLNAIENTNKFADMVENFTIDKTFKYPTLYGDNSDEQWKQLIFKQLKHKFDNNVIDRNKIEKYKTAIYEEFTAMSKQSMSSFMLFMSELMIWCRENDINSSPCRGSIGGSVIAYITDITDVDPIVWNTVFSRFCNSDRISLADIDQDFSPSDRAKVYNYIIKRFGNDKVSYILSLGTVQDRGSIDVLAKGLKYKNLDIVKTIKNSFDNIFEEYSKIIQEEVNLEELEGAESKSPNFTDHPLYVKTIRSKSKLNRVIELEKMWVKLRSDNKDLFYYFDGIKGTIISKGVHPAGMIGSPITLHDSLSVFYKGGDENVPISSCSMKAVDSVNFVKFDILGLKNVGVIQDTYSYINKKWEYSHEIDWLDKNVWNDMIKSNVGVFQFEGKFAFELLEKFNPFAINDMNLVNASLRPSGKSYRDRLINREFNQNPSEQIDNLLMENNGFLVFQEDTIKFLTDICGFSGSLADTTRRCVDENTFITMGNGDIKRIKNINVNDKVMSVNNYGVSESKTVKNLFNNGVKEVFKITTIHGKELIATSNHKVFTQDGYKCVKDLNTNDSIMSLKKINSDKDNLKPNQRLSSQEMFLIGMLIGDGTIYSISRAGKNNSNPSFTNSEMTLINKFKECINSRIREGKPCEFIINSQDGVNVDKIYNVRIKTSTSNNSLIRLLDKYNLRHHANNKVLHNELMSYPIGDKLQNLLGGLFSTDGGCYGGYIDYSTISETLAYQIKNLLLKYGVYTYINKKWIPDYNYYSYRVYISQVDSLVKFQKYILPYVIGNKNLQYNQVINKAYSNEIKYNYLLPNKCKEEVRNNMLVYNKSFNDIGLALGYKENNFNVHSTEFGISDIKAKEISKELYIPYTYWLLNTNYIPLRVKNIEYIGESNVYDIEVEDNHNYIANGLVVHNCIGKKDTEGLMQQLPKILEGYCNKSNKPREVAEQEVKAFIQIISDSSEYQFGYNHSTGYSMNGYMAARLRCYYPLEFTTAYLNRAETEEDIANGTKLAKEKGFKIELPKFGLSKGEYFFNKQAQTIYKGIGSLKGLSVEDGNELFTLSQSNNYLTFIDLIKDIKQKTSINDGKAKVLIKLDYFSNFGKSQKLLDILDTYNNIFDRKQIKKDQLLELNLTEELMERYSNKKTDKLYKEISVDGLMHELVSKIEDKDIKLKDKLLAEIELLGYAVTQLPNLNEKIMYVKKIDEFKNKKSYTYYTTLYDIKNGEDVRYRISEYLTYMDYPFKEGDIIKICDEHKANKKKQIDGKWQILKDEFNNMLDWWKIY